MVFLTTTPTILSALSALPPSDLLALDLPTPELGAPISHTQLLRLARHTPHTLAALLHTTTLYVAPRPASKPTQTPEYHALMARLRAEEEERAYTRLLAPPTRETFDQRFPGSKARAQAFSIGAGADEVDDVSYAEVHRQIILIINVLVSVVCVAVFVWVAARRWEVGKRLGLAMGSAVAVAVAEVVVYSGYVRRVQEAKGVEKRKPETREIVASWVLDGGEKEKEKVDKGEEGVRFRKGKHR